MLTPRTDVRSAQWVVHGLAPFATFCIGSLVPRGFERYVRIDHPQEDGWLPDVVSGPLKSILRPHTPAGAACWFAVWQGWGATYKAEVARAGLLDTGARQYDLFRGPLDALDFRYFVGYDATVNLAWSEDRVWLVCTDIDLDRTFVGFNSSVFEDLVGHPLLQAVEVRLEDSLVDRR